MTWPDWSTWTPTLQATLLFVRQGDQILLIRKKRGFGAGKVNAPGGKLDPGESFAAAAVREVEEEVGLRPLDPREVGRLRFQFVDGLRLEVGVFVAWSHQGELRATDEADPFWTSEPPYDEMWADDRLWLPEVLAGREVRFWASFDGDVMQRHEMEVRSPAASSR